MDAARDHVRAAWNYQAYTVSKRGRADEKMLYDSQRRASDEIQDAFLRGASLATFIAPPQWGKTGVAMQLMYAMTTHPDDTVATRPENVFLITGMSDTDWVRQTKHRMPVVFRSRVYHRNQLHRMVEDLGRARDALVIIDECHHGSEVAQTLHKCLGDAGVWDFNGIRERNIKILCISATPANVLVDAQQWGPANHRTIVAKGGEGYTGFPELLEEGRVRAADVSNPDYFTAILDVIEKRWARPRWHIIRATPSMLRGGAMKRAIAERGLGLSEHNSASRLDDIDNLLRREPARHHFIFIKQFWKAAKSLNDAFIGVCLEMSKDCSQAAQGLGGRLLGFGKQRGSTAPLLYCIPEAIEQYVAWFNNGCDYFMCERYSSASLKVRDGVVCRKKDSVVHSDHVVGLEPVTEPAKGGAASLLVPKKVSGPCPGCKEPPRLVTTLEVLDEPAFVARFGLGGGAPLATTAAALSKQLKAASVRANVSFSRNSAASRSNLVNYYTHRNWADDEYHITRIDGKGDFVVIRRDKHALENVEVGDVVMAHNHAGQLVRYRF
jgi:hypothetical protein